MTVAIRTITTVTQLEHSDNWKNKHLHHTRKCNRTALVKLETPTEADLLSKITNVSSNSATDQKTSEIQNTIINI